MSNLLVKYQKQFSKLIDFNPVKEQLLRMDFTAANTALTEELFTDTEKFSAYIQQKLAATGAAFGIGGWFFCTFTILGLLYFRRKRPGIEWCATGY